MTLQHYSEFANCSKHSWIHSTEYAEYWSRAVVDTLAINKTDRILDLGCGKGEIARKIADFVQPSDRIVGADVNKEMLATDGQLEWIHSEALEFLQSTANDRFTVVIMKQMIHHVPESARAELYRQLHRVVPQGGRVVVLTMPETILYPMIPSVTAAFEGNQIKHSTITTGLEQAGFAVETTRGQFPVRISWEDYAATIRERFISDLRPFSNAEIESGLEALHQTLDRTPALEFDDTLFVFAGRK